GQLLSLAMLAEALWKQGLDIYPDYNNRLLAAGEYFARVNDLSVATPFLPFGTTDQYYIADHTNRGWGGGELALRILHDAYVVRKRIPAPYMARRLQEMPVGGDSFMFIKVADPSTARPAAVLTLPATTSITSGFSDVEIGGASPTGGASYSGGTWTVKGGGNDIWGKNDSCHFTYQAVTGDCAIIAKVESVETTHKSARAGVMIRTSLSQGAPRAWMAVTPDSRFEQNIQGLAVYGGNNYSNKSLKIPSSSYWVKLERLGNIVTGYVSPDGTNWAATDVGRLDKPPATWYVGLVVCSTRNGTLNTSTFSNVQITGGNGGAPVVTPAAPAAFLAAPGKNAVPLRWQPSFGATSYSVKRATTSGGPYSTVAAGVTVNSYTDTTVTNGTTYHYVVTATNSAGTSGNSPQDSVTPVSPMVNVAFGGTASTSVVGSPAEGPGNGFDRNFSTKWYNGNGSNPGPTGWLRYDFGAGNAQTVKRYMVTSADVANRDPKNWTFQGSNDGSTWTTLDTQSSQTFANRSQSKTYNVANTTAYRYYQLNVIANNGANSLAIADLGLLSN
ncbi:MAG: DUF1349 domain-containing protein, partial [Luteolibacter sp.]|uniref:DUF1349 domain-containing protein n=1 Tax=Luteolibacter sp. TaxID=1962973 RepID=UPI0032637AC0